MYNEFESDIFDAIYPLTIIADRYGGVYSGGKFLAFNCLPNEVPEMVNTSDSFCRSFWPRFYKTIPLLPIGIGQTIEEAVGNLYIQLKREDN